MCILSVIQVSSVFFDCRNVDTVDIEIFVGVLSVPDEVATMTFVDVTDTSFVVLWSRPHFTNGILTGTSTVQLSHCRTSP